MKKLLIVILIILSVFGLSACQKNVEFDIQPTTFGDKNFGKDAFLLLENLSSQKADGFADRTAGKGGDKKMALQLAKSLQTFYKFTSDKNHKDLTDENGVPYVGVDAFDYQLTNGGGKTYNVVYTCKAVGESKGRILLMAQYDNLYAHNATENSIYKTDGAYESGASVAALMTIARYFSENKIQLQYDIDFAFLGGGSYGWLGAQEYLLSFSAEEREKIALAVNLSSVAGGDNLYAYGRDKKTDYADYFYQVGEKNSLGLKAVPHDKRITQGQIVEEQKTTYFHAGMLGNHMCFANNLIPTLNIMSANWEDNSLPSIVEKKGMNNVYQTTQDTFEQMIERSGGREKVEESLDKVVKLALGALSNENAKALDMALSTARKQEVNTLAQGASTNLALTIVAKALAIVAIFVTLGVARKFVNKNAKSYTPIIGNHIDGEPKENKPIDVFGWDNNGNGGSGNNGDDKGGQPKIGDGNNGDDNTKDGGGDVFEGF
ncbi:MAG: M28 family peptidase [Clostridia bacterium]